VRLSVLRRSCCIRRSSCTRPAPWGSQWRDLRRCQPAVAVTPPGAPRSRPPGGHLTRSEPPRPLHSKRPFTPSDPRPKRHRRQTGRGRQQYAEAADHPNTEHAYGHVPRYLGCYPKLGVVNQIRDTAAQHVPLMRARQAPRRRGKFPLIGGPKVGPPPKQDDGPTCSALRRDSRRMGAGPDVSRTDTWVSRQSRRRSHGSVPAT